MSTEPSALRGESNEATPLIGRTRPMSLRVDMQRTQHAPVRDQTGLLAMVKRAKKVGRTDFVKKYYDTYVACRMLRQKLPVGMVKRVVSFVE